MVSSISSNGGVKMKIGLIALLFTFLLSGTSNSEIRSVQKEVNCDNTVELLAFLQKEAFLPKLASTITASNGVKIFETIFINVKEKSIVVVETRAVHDESISCVVSRGENYMAVDQHGLLSAPFEDL